MILSKLFAKRSVRLADIFEEVLPGTLYKMIGRGEAVATASKCLYIPSCVGLL